MFVEAVLASVCKTLTPRWAKLQDASLEDLIQKAGSFHDLQADKICREHLMDVDEEPPRHRSYRELRMHKDGVMHFEETSYKFIGRWKS